MATRHKNSKHHQQTKDREETRKFLTVLAVATVAFMLLMYFMFAGR
jgi:hypothetical protein